MKEVEAFIIERFLSEDQDLPRQASSNQDSVTRTQVLSENIFIITVTRKNSGWRSTTAFCFLGTNQMLWDGYKQILMMITIKFLSIGFVLFCWGGGRGALKSVLRPEDCLD